MCVNEYLVSFRDRLKKIRKTKGYTQVVMAQKLCISSRKYQRLESGETAPSLIELVKLSKIFNTSLEYVVGTELIQEKLEIH